MKTLMTKSLIALVAMALCLASVAQNQPTPSREQEQPDDSAQPDPAELARQFLQQNAGTNGDATADQQQASTISELHSFRSTKPSRVTASSS